MRERETSWFFLPCHYGRVSPQAHRQAEKKGWRERDGRKRWREKMEKSKRGAMAFGRSVINKGPETHSDPVIDLTTGVKINTHTHARTHACAHAHTKNPPKLASVF